MVTFLVLLVFSHNVVFLFVGTASLGLSLSSTFPSMLAYTEDALQYRGEPRLPLRPASPGVSQPEGPRPPPHSLNVGKGSQTGLFRPAWLPSFNIYWISDHRQAVSPSFPFSFSP